MDPRDFVLTEKNMDRPVPGWRPEPLPPRLEPEDPRPLQIGGGLSAGGCFLAIALLVTACFGYGGAFALAPAVLALGLAGLVLSVHAGARHTLEPARALAGMAFGFIAILAGLVQLALWQGWAGIG